VSQKNVPDIFDCNLKSNYQILIIFGTNIYDTTAIKWLISFPPHQTLVSALSRENTTGKISLFYPMRYDCLINITRKNTFCSHFWHFGRHYIQLFIFQLPAIKLLEVLTHYVNTGMLSPFIDSSIDKVLLQSNPCCTSSFLTSSGRHAAAWQSNLVIDWPSD